MRLQTNLAHTVPSDIQIMPPGFDVIFSFRNMLVTKLTGVLFMELAARENPEVKEDQEYQLLCYWGDKLDASEPVLISWLQRHVSWKVVEPFLDLSPDSMIAISDLWQSGSAKSGDYELRLSSKTLPSMLYSYMAPNWERIWQLFRQREIFLSSPKLFNDPYDCSLSQESAERLASVGMKCLSARNNSRLMFSHYSKAHTGICVGFDSRALALSLKINQPGLEAEIRPVSYLRNSPPFRSTSIALWSACKDSDWSYEEEYRLILCNGPKPQPAGPYRIGPEAISEIIFGLKCADACRDYLRELSASMPHIKFLNATAPIGSFALELEALP